MEENTKEKRKALEKFGFEHTESLGIRRSVAQFLSDLRMRAAVLGKRLQLAFNRIDEKEYNEYVAAVNELAESSYRKRVEDYRTDRERPRSPLFANTVNYNAVNENERRAAADRAQEDGREKGSENNLEQGSPGMDFATHNMRELIERKLDTEVNEDRLFEMSDGLSKRLDGRNAVVKFATITREDGKEVDVLRIDCNGFDTVYLDKRLNPIGANGKFINTSYSLENDANRSLVACAPYLISEIVDKECKPFLKSPISERKNVGEALYRRAMELKDKERAFDHQMGMSFKAEREGEWLTFTGYNGKIIERVRADELHRFKDSRKALITRINESVKQAEIEQKTQMAIFEGYARTTPEPVLKTEEPVNTKENGTQKLERLPGSWLQEVLSTPGHPAYVSLNSAEKNMTIMTNNVTYEFDRTGRLIGGSAFDDPEREAEAVVLRARIVDAANRLGIDGLDEYVAEKDGIYPDRDTISAVLRADPGDTVMLSYRSPLTVELSRSEKEQDRIDGKIYLKEDGECREFSIDVSSDSKEKNVEAIQAVLAAESVDLNRLLVERYERSLEEEKLRKEAERADSLTESVGLNEQLEEEDMRGKAESITKTEEHVLDNAEKVFVLDAGYPEIPDDVQVYIHECLLNGSIEEKDITEVKDSVEKAVEKFPDLDESQKLAVMFYASDDLEKDYAAMFEKDVKEKTDEEREERDEREEDEPELGINERSIFA